MADPEVGKVYPISVWENRGGGRAWECGPWTAGGFPSELTVGGEGWPVGTFAVAGNSHNAEPRQTLLLQLRDPINYTRDDARAFGQIAGGYQPVGAAHVLLHRDWSWQDNMLKVIAGGQDGRLYRVYTWWYLRSALYRWNGQGWQPA